MKAHVTISDFGTHEQCQEVVDRINKNTMFHAYMTLNRNALKANDDYTVMQEGQDGYDSDTIIIIPVNVPEIGDLMGILSRDVKLNWIEYRIQFQS